MPLLIGGRATSTDGAAATRYLIAFFSIAAICHVFWQVVTRLLGWSEGEAYYEWFGVPAGSLSIVLVYLMLMAGLYRQKMLFALSVALVGLSLALRPTSSLAFTAIFAAVFITAHRLRVRRLLRRVAVVVVCGILAGNLAVLESSEVANAFYSI